MKKSILLIGLVLALIWSNTAYAFNSGSTGALGNYTATVSKTIQLPADGKLNYQSVHIYPNATITFQKNAANTPVYMLATGDVLIEGTINVNGTNATSNDSGKGGPGGYDGGYGGAINVSGGKGLGPGGGNNGGYGGSHDGGCGGGGGFGVAGTNLGCGTNPGAGGSTYGNAMILPLIGGSGGGGGGGNIYIAGVSGGGGGGAIVIASNTLITVSGTINAAGGNGAPPLGGSSGTGGGGSGGAVKLVANIVSGNGAITATGGKSGTSVVGGGAGRIRLEADTNNRTASTSPANSFGNPGDIFASNTPSLTITSIAGTSAPSSPTGNYSQPDLLLPSTTTNPVAVNISAANIPVSTSVKVWVIPQYGTATSVDTALSGTQGASTATANVNLSTAYSNVITAEATFTITAMNYNGEEINRIRVATTMGGKSEVFYITKSGKEIKGELIAGLIK